MDDSPTYDNTDRESESELDALYDSLKEHDDIRFATYRTAAKLRFIQRKTYLHHIDIWNMIEAFRENGLNTLEATTLVNRARLETILASLYNSLNKRLPPGQNVNVEKTSSVLVTWLLFCFSSDDTGRVKVFSIKMALAVLSCGKLMDKLRYVFSQLTDSNGQLIPRRYNTFTNRFTQFLKDVLKLPAAVGERQTFNITDSPPAMIFEDGIKVTVNDFLETMMSDPGPQSVSWLLVLHRITAAESVFHPVQCSGCQTVGFHGLRYKSDSSNYHLCQMCFWRGKMDLSHRDDVFKEYNVWKVPGKPSGLRRSMRCVPAASNNQRLPQFPDQPEQTLDLSNMVPASPLPAHNGFHSEPGSRHMSPAISGNERLGSARIHGSASPRLSRQQHPQQMYTQQQMENSSQRNKNDEHELIARYANRLAGQGGPDTSPEEDIGLPPRPVGRGDGGRERREPSRERREPSRERGERREPSRERGRGSSQERGAEKNSRRLVHELELKNAEIMREIQRLRQHRAKVRDMEESVYPGTVSELSNLRQRKMELEMRLGSLQETRKDLMVELEELMKILKVQGVGTQHPSVSQFSHVDLARHQNVGNKLRPTPHKQGTNGRGYERRSPMENNSESRSSPDSAAASNSIPASVTSLSD